MLPCIKDCEATKMDTASAYEELFNLTISMERGGISECDKKQEEKGTEVTVKSAMFYQNP